LIRGSPQILIGTAWQKPEEILDALHLQRTSSVADIGADTGYFSVRIAKRIPEGKIFAADIEPDMVRYLGERARHEHLTNLVPVQANADTANLPAVDVALVVNICHHIGNRPQYFAKLKSSLRPAGRLVIVDFKADHQTAHPLVIESLRKGSRKSSRPLATRSWTASVPAKAILPNLRHGQFVSSLYSLGFLLAMSRCNDWWSLRAAFQRCSCCR
jgi:SAM-dependent methyltransferase